MFIFRKKNSTKVSKLLFTVTRCLKKKTKLPKKLKDDKKTGESVKVESDQGFEVDNEKVKIFLADK